MRAPFAAALAEHDLRPLVRREPTTLQVNIGRRCDLACHHCHVEAGPKRSENMERTTVDRLLELLDRNAGIRSVDITGGAPELNPHFRHLVEGARARGRDVIDRCNLTVFFEPGQEDTPEFLARHGVRVVASLPCYTRDNVEQQRGRGVFGRSIAALQRLNALGYARADTGLVLDLVYNPLGATLPPPQAALEEDYRKELHELFGIAFDALITITNMPIRRFAHDLARQGRQTEYMQLLVESFNPATVDGLMCRDLVSVSWDGQLHDCDFNQMLELPLGVDVPSIWDVDDLRTLSGARIETADHCFGCTAGAGSSCGGALVRP